MAHRLWMTHETPRRFFLVPSEAALPAGSLDVWDLQFVRRQYLEAAIGSYEVSLDEAQAHVDAGWDRVVARVQQTWNRGAPGFVRSQGGRGVRSGRDLAVRHG